MHVVMTSCMQHAYVHVTYICCISLNRFCRDYPPYLKKLLGGLLFVDYCLVSLSIHACRSYGFCDCPLLTYLLLPSAILSSKSPLPPCSLIKLVPLSFYPLQWPAFPQSAQQKSIHLFSKCRWSPFYVAGTALALGYMRIKMCRGHGSHGACIWDR